MCVAISARSNGRGLGDATTTVNVRHFAIDRHPDASTMKTSALEFNVARRPKKFPRQFVIYPRSARRPLTVPESFHDHASENLICAACPSLPVVPLCDRSGQKIGIILGDPIELSEARFVRHAIQLTTDAEADVESAIEDLFVRLGGSFIIVLDGFGRQHTYLDACGSMSLVFDPATQTAAATTGLLLGDDAYKNRFDHSLYVHLNILRDGWFPGGLTAHTGIHRQLVNHRLDFATLRQARHWPRAPIAIDDDPKRTVAKICTATRAAIDAMRAEGPVTFGLTAGNESRMLLAICRDIAGQLNFATVNGPESTLDMLCAEALSLRHGLNHHRLPVVYASDDEAHEWHALTGHCMGGDNIRTHKSALAMAGKGAFAGGLGGEIGRGFFWRSGDDPQTTIDTQSLVGRFGMMPHPRVTEAVAKWHPSVAAFDPFLQLDLAYIELRMGCWAFAQAYAMPEVFHTNPMISRAAFANMLSLPPDWRRDGLMVEEAIRRHWPELLELPINRYGDYRDTLRLVRRAIRHPHLVAKKARKLFA